RLAEADRMGAASLQYVPDYAAALLVRGRIELAQKRPADAIVTLQRAARLNPLPEYTWTLADALRSLNRLEDAAAVEQKMLAERGDARTIAPSRAPRRQNVDEAVDLARDEMKKRSDVFTLDALAWALARAGHADEASSLMARALAEG